MENYLSPEMIEQAKEIILVYGLKVIAALAVFIIGKFVAKILRKTLEKMMARADLDQTLVKFVGSVSYIGMMAFVVLAALGQLGIETTSFIAILGAAGLAIGLALQGSLSNFAAGFLMILFRPFKLGDFIEGAGVAGKVAEIQIFTTTILTGDNKTIIIPNASLTSGNIVNYSAKPTRRVDMVFGVSYDDDLQKVRETLISVLSQDDRIHEKPEPLIVVSELADSSVNFTVRVWVDSADYWGVKFGLTEAVKRRFDQEGISFPYPQTDVHMIAES